MNTYKVKKRKRLFFLLLGLNLCLLPMYSHAKETMTKSETIQYVKGMKEPEVNFDGIIEEKGKKWKLIETKEKILKEEDKTITETKEEVQRVYQGDNYTPPKEIDKNGGIYQLSSTQVKLETLKKEENYISRESVPKTTLYPVSGRNIELSLKNIREEADVPRLHQIPIRVENIDAHDFVIEGSVQTVTGDILSYLEPDILRYAKLDSNQYHLVSLTWVGQPFVENGETIRNAIASINEDVTKYVGEYESEVKVFNLIYSREKVMETSVEKEITATYELVSRGFTPLMYLGIALVCIAIIILLFILAKKKKEKK